MIDIGVNLTDSSFGSDLEQVLERGRAAGVEGLVITGTSVERSRQAADLAARLGPGHYATAGVHPHDAKSGSDTTLESLGALCGRPEVVAVGECGLDYFRDLSPRPVQREWFEKQLQLAIEVSMPVFLHQRDAAADFAAILGALRQELPDACVHCFTGDLEALEQVLALDCHVGITGWICDERRGRELQEIVDRIPDDRLLIETDAPYLIPRSLRPRPKTRRNEPQWLTEVRDTVARCRDQSPEHIAEITTANARRFFRLDAAETERARA